MSYWIQPSVKSNLETIKNQLRIAENIIEKVCNYYNVTNSEIKGRCRKIKYIKPRYIAIYLIKQKTDLKLVVIADLFGRDHTTIIYAIQSINDILSLKYDTNVKDEYQEILNLI